MREVIGEHSGENQAGILIALFKEYKIGGNIGYFMANNVELNDTCINTVLQALYLNILAR